MKSELKTYLKAIQDWVADGCPGHPCFRTGDGLCINMIGFPFGGTFKEASRTAWQVGLEMEGIFGEQGLNRIGPFGYNALHKYIVDPESPPEHQEEVKARLEWIRKQLET